MNGNYIRGPEVPPLREDELTAPTAAPKRAEAVRVAPSESSQVMTTRVNSVAVVNEAGTETVMTPAVQVMPDERAVPLRLTEALVADKPCP